ncbi:MAG: hypothetical protein NT150_02265, partial [Bacteroidetes bacterium]|nr:hypothetical protein [Bacteroidota bacterium]
YYTSHALLLGGGCISFDSPTDIIKVFFYDQNGKLIKSERHFRNGAYVGTHFWTYNKNGLRQSVQEENSKEITIYEYEFY